ncbi:MAG: polyhydroxybutyrate depolymerase [Pseudomonadota bacterium]
MKVLTAIVLTALLLVAGCGNDESGPPEASKTRYTIDPQSISVSGVSAGAYMAGQFHVAHSSLVRGAGLIAGGPYGCALGSMQTALGACTKEGQPSLGPLLDAARASAAAGVIDSLDALAGQPAWLFRAPGDAAMGLALTQAAAEFYRAFDALPVEVTSVETVHGIPTLAAGVACDEFAPPYLNACGYDAAGEILKTLHATTAERGSGSGELRTVSVPGADDAHLLPEAYLYVPKACAAGETCGVHVFFHGCQQSSEELGDTVAREAGFNEWADAHSLLVLYPQVKSSKFAPLNPLGCFDWWGYTDDGYATRDGAQIRAVKTLLDQLAGTTL